MSDDKKKPERRSTLDGRFAPAVSHRLRRLLEELPTPFPCRYACFIHPRRRSGEQGFGVITLAGESLPLSVEMLAGLRQVPTLFEGRAPVVLGPADPEEEMIPDREGSWSGPLPVPRFLMRMLPVVDEDAFEGDAEPISDQVVTADSDWPQVTLLCASRPAGWPA